MKLLRTMTAVALAFLGTAALAADGLVAVKSPHGAKATMDRLEAQVKKRGLNVPQCAVAGNLQKALAGIAEATVARD